MSETRPCATRIDNQPTPSARPWRYGHAASIEGAHWDIYAGEGIDGWLVGMVTTEADAALIVEAVAALATPPVPAGDEPDWTANDGHMKCRDETRLARDLAGHRVRDIHDCFSMNCRDLGDEIERLYASVRSIDANATEPSTPKDARERLAELLPECGGAECSAHQSCLAYADWLIERGVRLTSEGSNQ